MESQSDIGQRIRQGVERRRGEFASMTGSYRCDIEDRGSWYIGMDHGSVTVREGRLSADCIIKCSEPDFWAIVDGRQNLLTAAMQGRVEIEGDLALAQKLHGLLPGPVPLDRELPS